MGYSKRTQMQSSNYGNDEGVVVEEEEDNIVLVRYDDDPAVLQPILANLATPSDPFARAIVTQVGWNQQITAVFQGDSRLDPLKVVGLWDSEEFMPLNTVTNVGLIGESLARLNLSNAKTDGPVCGVLAEATDALKLAVVETNRRLRKMKRANVVTSPGLRYERASGFFLPVWTFLDQMNHVDADAADILDLSRRIGGQAATAANTFNQQVSDKSALGLLNLVSSHLNLHLVHKIVRRSGAFGRSNQSFHQTLLSLFDRRRVTQNRPGVMKRISTTENDIQNVIQVERVSVKVTLDLIPAPWRKKHNLNFPESDLSFGSSPVVMNGVLITLSQHDHTKQKISKTKFKTGTHAVIHFRWATRVVALGEEAKRGTTLSFVYRWPEVNDLTSGDPINVKKVKIVLYGSGKVNWWEDYYQPQNVNPNDEEEEEEEEPSHSNEGIVLPYPSRRVYITETETWIEYHDIMQLIFAQALYGHFSDIPNSIKVIQPEFATLISGATKPVMAMIVVDARAIVPEEDYPRFNARGTKLRTFQNNGQVIREFPQMRDVLLMKVLGPHWETMTVQRGKARKPETRTKKSVVDIKESTVVVPREDLSLKEKESDIHGQTGRIAIKLRDMTDATVVETTSWRGAGQVGLEYLMNGKRNIPEVRMTNVLKQSANTRSDGSPSQSDQQNVWIAHQHPSDRFATLDGREVTTVAGRKTVDTAIISVTENLLQPDETLPTDKTGPTDQEVEDIVQGFWNTTNAVQTAVNSTADNVAQQDLEDVEQHNPPPTLSFEDPLAPSDDDDYS